MSPLVKWTIKLGKFTLHPPINGMGNITQQPEGVMGSHTCRCVAANKENPLLIVLD